MHISSSITELRQRVRAWRRGGDTVALVPTMGNLHAGHLELVAEARRSADRVVVSIFVNPTQFGPVEDFSAYPRTPEADVRHLQSAQADLLFMPEISEMYPLPLAQMTLVEVPGISDDLCGKFRPGHFRGVATVVLKLLNQVQPDMAVFGEKDYQQLMVIRRMVDDLNLPVRVMGVPTVRESGGLALSSRNAYLTEDERRHASILYDGLRRAAESLQSGCRDLAQVEAGQSERLIAAGLRPDYFAIRRQEDLRVPVVGDRRLIVLVAARLGRTRLIDNLTFELDPGY